MPDVRKIPLGPEGTSLSIALLGPDEGRRTIMNSALALHEGLRVREFTSFPPKLNEVAQALAQQYDVVIVDVDSNVDTAATMSEILSATGQTVVMAYSAQADMKLAVRFMRAGAREFFTLPLDPSEVTSALRRATMRVSPASGDSPKATSKVFVFLGSKGGCGVTTLASNFALLLYEESERETLLIDLGEPLGDVGINLGFSTEFSLQPALDNHERLDGSMMATMVQKHSSGLSVLAAPSDLPDKRANKESVDKLIAVARESYPFVVVDAGSRVDLMDSALFDSSSTVYLVTQMGLTEMRNANRMILKHFSEHNDNLQIVINRYRTSDNLFDDSQVSKALTKTAQWKIADDYATARRTRNTLTPLAMVDSPISQTLRQMARIAGGVVGEKTARRGFFRLFG